MKVKKTKIKGYNIDSYQILEDLSVTIAYECSLDGLPANGGMRFCEYASQEEQEVEALTLAIHMTEKHKIYNTGFVGAKLVANGKQTTENKRRLLDSVSKILNDYQGKIYTGCDININNEDMDYMATMTPYILNGINSDVNTSTATAYGVYGSLNAVMDMDKHPDSKLSFLIHGTGKIGSVIANKLVAKGHTVYTYDVNKESANILGAMNISNDPKWYTRVCDYMVLCSKCGVINDQNVNELNCRWILSSANAPFSNKNVETVLTKRHIDWIPDVVSNAGAVICDEFEHKDLERYNKTDPNKAYSYIYNAKYKKTKSLLNLSIRFDIPPQTALATFFIVSQNDDILQANLLAI